MGSNIVDFIKEAYRILKPGGILKIVEVRSRFHDKDSGNGLDAFVLVISNVVFHVIQEQSNQNNKMFFFLECTKRDELAEGTEKNIFTNMNGNVKKKKLKTSLDLDNYSAKPCLYKRR